jgi:hypothetical protein
VSQQHGGSQPLWLVWLCRTNYETPMLSWVSFTLAVPPSIFRNGISVVGWIISVLPDREGFAGYFPPLKGHEAAATRYEQWLTKHGV